MADARHTLVAAGSQKHFIYVWMAAGAQFCLAQAVCCGLWHLFASLLSPWHTLSPSLLGLCSVLHISVYVCIRTCLELGMYAVCFCLCVLWTAVKIHFFFFNHEYHIKRSRQRRCFISIFHTLFYLCFFSQKVLAPLIKHEKFFRKWFWNWN